MKINNANASISSFLILIDPCNQTICNLKTLHFQSNLFIDLVLSSFIIRKLDSVVRHRWEISLEGEDQIQELNNFCSFLEIEAMTMGLT